MSLFSESVASPSRFSISHSHQVAERRGGCYLFLPSVVIGSVVLYRIAHLLGACARLHLRTMAAAGLTFELADGERIPAIGFGTFEIKEEDAEGAVLLALQTGYRHIDTAEGYGNESGVGRAIAKVGRDRLFITTKLWPGNPAWGQPSKDQDATVAACKASIARLGVQQVDLYLTHGPFGGKEARLAQYRGLVECQRLGLTKSIGVSNFSVAHLQELADAGLPVPAANQVELHPQLQRAELLDYMRSRKIAAIAYSSLAPLSCVLCGLRITTGTGCGSCADSAAHPFVPGVAAAPGGRATATLAALRRQSRRRVPRRRRWR